MVKQIHYILLLFCVLSVPFFSLAQIPDSIPEVKKYVDEDRAHSFFNNIISNPAYTGIFGGHNILVNTGIDKPFFKFRDLYTPQQYNLAYDVAFGKKKNNAVGASYSNVTGGIFKSTSFGLTYARNINLTKNTKFYQRLRLGAAISYNRRANDWDLVKFGDMIDPKYGFIWNTSETRANSLRGYLNFDFGTWYHNPFFYLGVAIKNITEPDLSFYGVSKIPREFIISTGGKININNDFAIHPVLNLSLISEYGGKLSTYSPALTASFENSYFLGVSYKDMNKFLVYGGAMAFDCISLSVAYGISTNTNLDVFGYPAFISCDLRINIKNQH